jgi:hypothetical protein
MPEANLIQEAARWTGAEFAEKAQLVMRLAHLSQSTGLLPSNTYYGVRRIDIQPADLQRQVPKFQELADKAASLAGYAATIANYLGFSSNQRLADVKSLIAIFRTVLQMPPGAEGLAVAVAASPSPLGIAEAAALGASWREQQERYLRTFHPAAWSAAAASLRPPLARGAAFWLVRAGKAYREAGRSLASLLSVPLPKHPADRLALTDALIENPPSA